MEKKFFLKDKYFWVLFLFMCIISEVLFFDFLTNKRLYIFYDVGGDTRQSYWPMYHYIVESFRNGSLNSWSFQIGLGTSTFTLYSFLFDPFIILLLLLPLKYLTYGILLISITKILVSGVLFYFYLNLLSIKKYPAVIASLIWAFNGYMMLWGQHYWFATMIVLFTFIMLSLELWLRAKKKFFFPISIAIMGINSPYFLFMISLFIFFYVIFHHVFTENTFTFKLLFSRLARFFGAYFIGLGASAIVFLPVSYLILTSSRLSGSQLYGNIFELSTFKEYISIFMRLFSNNTLGIGINYYGAINYYEGPMLFSSLLFIIALPQLLFVKIRIKHKVGIIISGALYSLLLLFPFFSKLFSAFSSFNYRWNFLLVFLNVLTIAYMLYFFSKEKRISYFGISLSALFVIIGWFYSYKIMIFQSMIPSSFLEERYLHHLAFQVAGFLIVYVIIFIIFRKTNRILWILLLFIVSIELVISNYPTINNRLTVSVDIEKKKEGYFDYTNEAVKYIKTQDEGFFRIDKNYNSYSYNDSLFQNYNGVKSYNSLNQPNYISFFKRLNTGVYDSNLGSGFNQRPILRDMTGVKYVLSKDENVPNEYIKLKTFGDVHVFKNPNSMPIAYLYDTYITEKEFDKLMPFEKDNVLLHAAVSDTKNFLKKFNPKKHLNEQYINIKTLTLVNSEIKSQKNNKEFLLITESNDPWMGVRLPKKERGWRIEFEIKGPNNTKGEIFWKSEDGVFNIEDSIAFEVRDIPVKVAYEINNNNLSEFRIDPGSDPGQYRIKNLKIVPVGDDEKQEAIRSLVNDKVILEKFSNNNIKGNFNIDKDKLLFFSIPYDKGWTLKIDGKRVPTVRVNMGFTGAFISKGSHSFELEYHQPMLKIGIIISVFCWAIILASIIPRKKTRVEV
ncbi:YfhO family protein [Bacillus sp. FJAT-29814]|uniref:YfhO family protein n=1 Tax=Bacillus sp. FJAT-29814 TaxID=1729688 RepID=UPI00082C3C6F|nr:YfhO family protein [Bacillus sp. FJAT-29814]